MNKPCLPFCFAASFWISLKRHKIHRVFIVILLCYACSRMGEAEVRVHENTVCFTIPNKEFRRGSENITRGSFHGYTVYEEESKMIWGYHIDSIPFKKGDCFAYGVLPEGAKLESYRDFPSQEIVESPEIPPELRLNTLYSVSVHATDTSDISPPAIAYFVQFCLQRHDDLIVVEQARKRHYRSCDQIKEDMSKEAARERARIAPIENMMNAP